MMQYISIHWFFYLRRFRDLLIVCQAVSSFFFLELILCYVAMTSIRQAGLGPELCGHHPPQTNNLYPFVLRDHRFMVIMYYLVPLTWDGPKVNRQRVRMYKNISCELEKWEVSMTSNYPHKLWLCKSQPKSSEMYAMQYALYTEQWTHSTAFTALHVRHTRNCFYLKILNCVRSACFSIHCATSVKCADAFESIRIVNSNNGE